MTLKKVRRVYEMVRRVGFEPTNPFGTDASGLRLWPSWATSAHLNYPCRQILRLPMNRWGRSGESNPGQGIHSPVCYRYTTAAAQTT